MQKMKLKWLKKVKRITEYKGFNFKDEFFLLEV